MLKQQQARERRHRIRQDEIIAATRPCFCQSGFHAATMAQLADAAGLSVGQIYRYFPSKDALVEEMVQRIVDKRVAEMIAQSDLEHLIDQLTHRLPAHREDEVLMLEVAAEASRNPRVYQILQQAQNRLFHNACQNMQNHYPHLGQQQREACVEILAVLVEGSAFRRVTGQSPPAAALGRLYKKLIRDLLVAAEDVSLTD